MTISLSVALIIIHPLEVYTKSTLGAKSLTIYSCCRF
jgi:hypothetical protein